MKLREILLKSAFFYKKKTKKNNGEIDRIVKVFPFAYFKYT